LKASEPMNVIAFRVLQGPPENDIFMLP